VRNAGGGEREEAVGGERKGGGDAGHGSWMDGGGGCGR
jgi:hypothetical protein